MTRKLCATCLMYFKHEPAAKNWQRRVYCSQKCYDERLGDGPEKMKPARTRFAGSHFWVRATTAPTLFPFRK